MTLQVGLLPAVDQERRVGVLLVNPGGPGVDMSGFLNSGAGLSERLLNRFDVVGWNPRGVMGSVPHGCRDEAERLMLLDPLPDTAAEEAALDTAAREVADACRRGLAGQVGLIGTDRTVADMDLIRQALGEEQISYLGFSYGSLLGLLYADRYGAHVRATAVDGVIDPGLSSEEVWVGQTVGFIRVIDAMFDACRQNPACPVDGDPLEAHTELAARVEADPLRNASGEVVLGPAEVLGAVIFVAYGADQWSYFYDGLAQAQKGNDEVMARIGRARLKFSDMGSFISINCNDIGPLSEADLKRLQDLMAAAAEGLMGAAAGDIARSATLSVRPCVYWADTDPRSVGTVRAADAPAVLVIGNRG